MLQVLKHAWPSIPLSENSIPVLPPNRTNQDGRVIVIEGRWSDLTEINFRPQKDAICVHIREGSWNRLVFGIADPCSDGSPHASSAASFPSTRRDYEADDSRGYAGSSVARPRRFERPTRSFGSNALQDVQASHAIDQIDKPAVVDGHIVALHARHALRRSR